MINSKKKQKKRNAYKPTLQEIQEQFNLPLDQAALALDICETKLKKLCREYGIKKWPYRSFRSNFEEEEQATFSVKETPKSCFTAQHALIAQKQQELRQNLLQHSVFLQQSQPPLPQHHYQQQVYNYPQTPQLQFNPSLSLSHQQLNNQHVQYQQPFMLPNQFGYSSGIPPPQQQLQQYNESILPFQSYRAFKEHSNNELSEHNASVMLQSWKNDGDVCAVRSTITTEVVEPPEAVDGKRQQNLSFSAKKKDTVFYNLPEQFINRAYRNKIIAEAAAKQEQELQVKQQEEKTIGIVNVQQQQHRQIEPVYQQAMPMSIIQQYSRQYQQDMQTAPIQQQQQPLHHNGHYSSEYQQSSLPTNADNSSLPSIKNLFGFDFLQNTQPR